MEAALGEHPLVRDCVVVVREEAPGERRLIAYFVSDEGKVTRDEDDAPAPSLVTRHSSLSSDLRRFLREKLPESMLPSAFVQLEALPLTAHGKVDRHALPAPDSSRPEVEAGFLAPRNAVELQLATIWEAALGIRPVGVRDNFFDLGGHSLLAVRVFAQIERIWGKNLPLVALFQAPTVEQTAAAGW